MTTQRELEVLKIEDVRKAKVGQIVATLKDHNRQHALVIDEAADGRQSVAACSPSPRLPASWARKCRASNWRELLPKSRL